jgi:hypothetical protein
MDKLDKEIQEALDQHLHQKGAASELETNAYNAVYEALNSLPNEDYLSTSFADKVVSKIERRAVKKDAEAFWWFGSIIFFMLLSGFVIIALTMETMGAVFIDFVSKYAPMMGLLTFVVVGVQLLDKRLIKLQV